MKEGVLTRRWESGDGNSVKWLIVLPKGLQEQVLEELCVSGATGRSRIWSVLLAVRESYYWLGMREDVRAYLYRKEGVWEDTMEAGRKRYSSRVGKDEHNRSRALRSSVGPGEFVWLWDDRESGSTGGNWQGPYQVLARLPGGSVRIQRAKDCRARVVQANRVALYRGRDLKPWESSTPVVTREEGPSVHRKAVQTGDTRREV